MRVIQLFFFILICKISFSQIIVTNPSFPVANQSVVITYDATQGNAGLINFTGDIYAHTGVITNLSTSGSDWKYVKAAWSVNSPECKMTRISTNLYQLTISPTIKDYYGVPDSETILKMGFVFRNSDGSLVGKTAQNGDIFVDVYQNTLSVDIITPESMINIIEPNDSVFVKIASQLSTSLQLYLDNVLQKTTTTNSLLDTFVTSVTGIHWIKAIATDGTSTVSDSVYFYVKHEPIVMNLPSSGLKDGFNVIDNNTATLVLFAPNKEYVFVLGDFNQWQLNEDYLMHKTPDGNRHWITINGLNATQEYAYQFLVNGNLKIADPYTEKVLDPWNDSYISSSVYPNLKPYPTGKTDGIVSVFQIQQPTYTWTNATFTAPSQNNLIIYELWVQNFTTQKSIKALIDTLDYIQNLGVNAIELMPVNEFEGNISWGYNPSFYFAFDKTYGTKNTFKEFIDTCHTRGIAVIIDMVLNHSYGQSPFVQLYFNPNAGTWGQPSAENPWYNQTCPHPPYCWGSDFNHSSDHTRKLVDSITSFWLTEYKIDGFRFDFTKGFTNTTTSNQGWSRDGARIQNIKRMADKIWDVNSNAYVILEHFTENDEEKELAEHGCMVWGNMNSGYNEASMGWTGASNITWASYKARNWNVPNLITYMESHDEERLMVKNIKYGNSNNPSHDVKNLTIACKRMELVNNFFIPIPGPKMIWQFGELGYDVSIDFECRTCEKPLHWEYWTDLRRQRIYHVIKALTYLKHNYPTFITNDFSASLTGGTKKILLNHTNMDVLIVGNFDVTTQKIESGFSKTGYWYELYTGDTINVTNVNMELTLEPAEYRLYSTVKLETPYRPIGIKKVEPDIVDVLVYPNPTNSLFTIIYETNKQGKVNIEIQNILGQVLSNHIVNSQFGYNEITMDANTLKLQSGIYYIKMSQGIHSITKKLIVK